jgi:hypothetical protein
MDEGSATCDVCQPGYYMDIELQRCGKLCCRCPSPGTECDSKGNTLVALWVKPGYFRAGPESKKVYECTLGKDACPGGNGTGDALCSAGYEGALCSRSVPAYSIPLPPWDLQPTTRDPSNSIEYISHSSFCSLVLVLLSLHSFLTYSCQEGFYHDTYSTTCMTCENRAQAAAPLIVLGTIIVVGGGLVAYNYHDLMAYCTRRKEHLFVRMNQCTIVVSECTNMVHGS